MDPAKIHEIEKAIVEGYEFWKDHPSMPNQALGDMALSVRVALKNAGFNIVSKPKPKAE